ncbi:MAG TPA: enoyl-CoA hydratase [Microbacterium sp.]|uniref:enoyl-CoA hydratase/isomerase family protein n=1 Tax=Microbacterium TaxID=33882 RepID=UPI000C537143|nr:MULTISPECIES: enoyl-CoA hydratase/isomerase family protein [Microbacterium]MBU21302.1 enoyl-CoA hydratase [Microbacterium sp.]MCE7483309.1 enoyl-CoA hydratase/isomerase family protein [Microbacterium profundi]HBS08541.1 enoyl-CoA hydratase [Microbacterium sp.]HBU43943.1 enoyl-CoA hydratase [Microbacterium sp.]
MTTLILREGADRLHVELNRPDVRNAINDDMVDELHAVCTSLEREPRILILTGTSTPERGVFAAGADIRQLLERGRDEALAGINSGLFTRIARLPMPVIAAVDGFAIGGGAELAYAADIRIASTRAVFGNPETAIGILAAAGATWRLAELVGEPLAKEILFTGRRLDAEEALRCGLVASVHAPDQLAAAADTVADRIAGQDPLALRVSKRVLAAPRDAHPLVDELAQAILFESDAKTQLMTRFLNRSQETR